MSKRIFLCFCLTLSAIALNFGLGMSATQSGETAPKITMLEALKIATELVPGRVLEAELEDEEDMVFYEIEIVSSDGIIIEVQVDAKTGQIIRQAREGEVSYITVEEAIKSATEFLRWNVVEIELDEEDGKAVYEIKLINHLGDDQEIEVDALSGKVLEPEPNEAEKDSDKESENGKD
jgi:uncharacterized membrane protein YkoI